jgi:DNA polymerase
MPPLCTKCRLSSTRDRIVSGRGMFPAPLFLMGEGPGASEDMLGIAFVGPSGRLLDKLLERVGYPGGWYVTNAVQCHPTDVKRGENREPLPDEVLSCMPRVMSEYRRCSPRAVVFLGQISTKYYERLISVPKLHILHPAALLRAGGEAAPAYPRTVFNLRDFLQREGLV